MASTAEILLTDKSEEVLRAFEEDIQTALEAIGMEAVGDCQLELENAPPGIPGVDTGRLRNSIAYAVQDDSCYVGTNVEYAPYVEYGTSKMAANPFLRNGVSKNGEKYKQIMESVHKS